MSPIQADFWHLMGLLLAFIGVLIAFARMLLTAIDKRIDGLGDRLTRLEKELADHKADLPLHYWRREDAIRMETQMKAKLDAIGEHIMKIMEKLTR